MLLCLALAFAALNIAAMLGRSLIPRSLDAAVERIEVRPEKRPGVDDVWLVHLDGRAVHVDAEIAEGLRAGDRLSKVAWSPTLRIDESTARLALSRDARGMLWVMVVTFLACVSAAMVSRRVGRERQRVERQED